MKKYFIALVVFVTIAFELIAMVDKRISHSMHSQLLYEREKGKVIWIFSYMRVRFNEAEDFTFHRHQKIPKPMRIFYENGESLSIMTNRIEYLGVHYDFDKMSTCVITETNCVPNAFIRTFK